MSRVFSPAVPKPFGDVRPVEAADLAPALRTDDHGLSSERLDELDLHGESGREPARPGIEPVDMIEMPCQIVRGGRRLVYRLLWWNEWQGVFLRTVQALRC